MKHSEHDQVLVVSAGVTLYEVVKAYEKLKQKNIHIRIIDIFSINPIDKDELIKSLNESKNKLFIIEDYFERGGICDRVVRALAGHSYKLYHRCVDKLPISGKPEHIYK